MSGCIKTFIVNTTFEYFFAQRIRKAFWATKLITKIPITKNTYTKSYQ